jgi:hypothetical protein
MTKSIPHIVVLTIFTRASVVFSILDFDTSLYKIFLGSLQTKPYIIDIFLDEAPFE